MPFALLTSSFLARICSCNPLLLPHRRVSLLSQANSIHPAAGVLHSLLPQHFPLQSSPLPALTPPLHHPFHLPAHYAASASHFFSFMDPKWTFPGRVFPPCPSVHESKTQAARSSPPPQGPFPLLPTVGLHYQPLLSQNHSTGNKPSRKTFRKTISAPIAPSPMIPTCLGW